MTLDARAAIPMPAPPATATVPRWRPRGHGASPTRRKPQLRTSRKTNLATLQRSGPVVMQQDGKPASWTRPSARQQMARRPGSTSSTAATDRRTRGARSASGQTSRRRQRIAPARPELAQAASARLDRRCYNRRLFPRPRICPHAPQPIPSGHRQGSPRRRRNRQPPADAARRHDPQARRRPLHLEPAGPARAAQGRDHRARGNGPRRRDRDADAVGPAEGAVGRNRPLGEIRRPAAEDQGSQGRRNSATAPRTRKSSPISRATS